jgi:hypothetical protein
MLLPSSGEGIYEGFPVYGKSLDLRIRITYPVR